MLQLAAHSQLLLSEFRHGRLVLQDPFCDAEYMVGLALHTLRNRWRLTGGRAANRSASFTLTWCNRSDAGLAAGLYAQV